MRVLNSTFYYYRTESNVVDMEGKEVKDCDSHRVQSLCCETLEGADEDYSVAHSDASGTPVNRKMKGKEEKYTGR